MRKSRMRGGGACWHRLAPAPESVRRMAAPQNPAAGAPPGAGACQARGRGPPRGAAGRGARARGARGNGGPRALCATARSRLHGGPRRGRGGRGTPGAWLLSQGGVGLCAGRKSPGRGGERLSYRVSAGRRRLGGSVRGRCAGAAARRRGGPRRVGPRAGACGGRRGRAARGRGAARAGRCWGPRERVSRRSKAHESRGRHTFTTPRAGRRTGEGAEWGLAGGGRAAGARAPRWGGARLPLLRGAGRKKHFVGREGRGRGHQLGEAIA
jgi:hypothetical protein